MIKFIAAALWLCSVTLGAVMWAAQPSPAPEAAAEQPPLLGPLDSIKTDVIPVPVLRGGTIQGYFLGRFVYTVEPAKLAKLSVPSDTLITDQVYTFLYGNPQIDFSKLDAFDMDAFRNGLRDSINKRVGDTLVHDVMVDQIDFLSKDEIRDNVVRRRGGNAGAGGNKVASPESHH